MRNRPTGTKNTEIIGDVKKSIVCNSGEIISTVREVFSKHIPHRRNRQISPSLHMYYFFFFPRPFLPSAIFSIGHFFLGLSFRPFFHGHFFLNSIFRAFSRFLLYVPLQESSLKVMPVNPCEPT